MDIYSKALLITAIFSTVLFLGRLILLLTLGDHHSIFDIHADSNDSSGIMFEMFSLQSISIFVMSFSWMGFLARTKWYLGFVFIILISLIFAFAMMFLLAYLMFKMKGLNDIKEFDIYECIGSCGKAYTNLKPNEIGQVQIVADGKLMTMNAINKSNEAISSFKPIIVTNIEDDTLIVSEYEGE